MPEILPLLNLACKGHLRIHGGQIVAEGSLEQIMENKKSITGKYLSGKLNIEIPKNRRNPKDFITILGARENNLKKIDEKNGAGGLVGKSTYLEFSFFPPPAQIKSPDS